MTRNQIDLGDGASLHSVNINQGEGSLVDNSKEEKNTSPLISKNFGCLLVFGVVVLVGVVVLLVGVVLLVRGT